MPETLLRTKLFIPPLRPNFVPRPRLIERLNQGLQPGHKLTLISAPAGFGKTTLITDWVQRSKEKGEGMANVAWLSLDKNDNDPIRFLTYFAAALNRVNPSFGQEIQAMLSSSQPGAMEPFISAIINDIAAAGVGAPIVLILEDYHFINSPAIQAGLDFLLDHLPHHMHLVMTSRSDPPLALSRLRARNQMVEIRARDLRFRSGEVAAFLSDTMGLDPTSDMVTTFEQRTEGWVAGLQLAAVSLQQQGDPLGFMAAFAGDDRYVADYLMEEVFRQQPAPVQTFLLGTSILDSLSGPLCDTVLEGDNSQATLNELEASNLFIVPLDNQRRWYRYHHLFADLLRQRLEESGSKEDIEALHRRASRWYDENDYLILAVEHALAAGDHQSVARLIEEGEGEIFQGSQLNTLLRWWAKLPPEIVESRPKLYLIYGWAWLATGHPEEAESCLQAVEKVLGAKMGALFSEEEALERLAPAVEVVLVEVAVLRGQLAIVRGDIEESLALSRRVLPYLDENGRPFLYHSPATLRTTVYFNIGMAHKLRGELDRAEQALSKAVVLGQEQGEVHLVAIAYGHLADVQAMQGHLPKAMQTCHQGLSLIQETAGRRTPMSGLLQVELGELHYERGELEAAYHHLNEGISVARPWGHLDTLLAGYTALARLRAAQGDWSGAFAALDEVADLGRRNPEAILQGVEPARARLWAALGNVETAGLWADKSGLQVDGELNYLREEEYITLARVLLGKKRWDDAERLIGRLLKAAESGDRWGRVIELLILRALALDAQDLEDEALKPLARALTLAAPQGYTRIFVDQGAPMARALYRAAAQGIMPEYTGELLAALQGLESGPDAAAEAREPQPGIVEPLSARELEVLACLGEGLSNREIAQQLTISLTTVKTHTRNIYGKLNVHSRTQAVARSLELGLLSRRQL